MSRPLWISLIDDTILGCTVRVRNIVERHPPAAVPLIETDVEAKAYYTSLSKVRNYTLMDTEYMNNQ